MTLDVYSHALPSMQQGAADKLENLSFAKLTHSRHTELKRIKSGGRNYLKLLMSRAGLEPATRWLKVIGI